MSRNRRVPTLLTIAVIAIGMNGCATKPPRSLDNICDIFKEKAHWYKAAKSSEKKWHSPIPVTMAFVYQESRFQAKAKPPREKILWVIPGPRPSSAYGYSQAKDDTWDWYRRDSGHGKADRNDFDDAIDFIGWYNAQSHDRNGIANNDAYHLYLAYHEGHGGFERRSFKNDRALQVIAREVSSRSIRYAKQLSECRRVLEKPWWRLF